MSSSYSSLDWVLSHWTHYTVPKFICVYVYVQYTENLKWQNDKF